jgi:hypothetical protein
MNARSRAVLHALLPDQGAPGLPGVFESGFEAFYADFKKTALPSMRFGFCAAVATATWISPLLIRRLPPLSRLSPEEREKALCALGKSDFYLLRQMSLLLKAVVSFHYGARPEVRRAIRFPQ